MKINSTAISDYASVMGASIIRECNKLIGYQIHQRKSIETIADLCDVPKKVLESMRMNDECPTFLEVKRILHRNLYELVKGVSPNRSCTIVNMQLLLVCVLASFAVHAHCLWLAHASMTRYTRLTRMRKLVSSVLGLHGSSSLYPIMELSMNLLWGVDMGSSLGSMSPVKLHIKSSRIKGSFYTMLLSVTMVLWFVNFLRISS